MIVLYADVALPHCYKNSFCKLILGAQVCMLCTPEDISVKVSIFFVVVESLSVTSNLQGNMSRLTVQAGIRAENESLVLGQEALQQ